MSTYDYEPTSAEVMRGFAQMQGDQELIDLVEKGWWS